MIPEIAGYEVRRELLWDADMILAAQDASLSKGGDEVVLATTPAIYRRYPCVVRFRFTSNASLFKRTQQQKRPRCRGLKVDRLYCVPGDATATSFSLRRPSSSVQLSFWLPSVNSPIEICDLKKNRSVIHI